MILVDTSVWADHLRRNDVGLAALLDRASVLVHPFVIGEVACGSLADRQLVLDLLSSLPTADVANFDEVLLFIERQELFGKEVGYVDAHLLASVWLTDGASLWTRDKRLKQAAEALGRAYPESDSH